MAATMTRAMEACKEVTATPAGEPRLTETPPLELFRGDKLRRPFRLDERSSDIDLRLFGNLPAVWIGLSGSCPEAYRKLASSLAGGESRHRRLASPPRRARAGA